MIHNRRNAVACILLVMALLSATDAIALGIIPAKTIIDFEPNLSKAIPLTIINNEQNDISVTLLASGELAPYVSFRESALAFAGDEGAKQAEILLTLPQALEWPGVHEASIAVTQVQSGRAENSGTAVTASPSLIHRLLVRVPYPKQHLEARLLVPSVERGQSQRVVVLLFNLGAEAIENASAAILIKDREQLLNALPQKHTAVSARGDALLAFTRQPKEGAGIYAAHASIAYATGNLSLQQEFGIGEPKIAITSVKADPLTTGIIPLRITLYLEWNRNLSGIIAYGIMKNSSGEAIAQFTTPEAALLPGASVVTAYLEAGALPDGIYNLTVRVTHERTTAELSIPIKMRLGMATIGEQNDFTMLLLATVILLIILSLYHFYHKRKEL